jgi:hypothetical protein
LCSCLNIQFSWFLHFYFLSSSVSSTSFVAAVATWLLAGFLYCCWTYVIIIILLLYVCITAHIFCRKRRVLLKGKLALIVVTSK